MAQSRLYEDIKPPYEWAHDERSDTLILHVEGFSRSQLRVQVMSTGKVRVSGERPKEDNTWCRFYLELPIPSDSDTNDISAKFDKSTLFVRFPKVITPVTMPQQQPPPPTQKAPPPPPPPPPPPKLTTREEPKAEAKEKETETMDETKLEQKEKEQPKESKRRRKKKKEDISKGKELMKEAKAKDKDHRQAEETRRASFSESFSSKKAQDAIAAMVEELKKQRNLINRLVVVFVVLLLGLYLKHLFKSTFGGSESHQEL